MKKFILSTAAILLAFIFSAFMPDNPEIKTNTVEEELYWYRIDATGKIGASLNSGGLATKSEVLTEANCPDAAGDDCARGYEEPQTFGTTAPGVLGNDRHIMKD